MSTHGTLYFKYISIVTAYDRTKTIVDDQSVKLKPVNISHTHFKGKPPNLMTVKFSRYTVNRLHSCAIKPF